MQEFSWYNVQDMQMMFVEGKILQCLIDFQMKLVYSMHFKSLRAISLADLY
uniref:Uncharacterized protein n=1 Tax=Arundo donax TaxID=35708 RepID=A0A0A9FIL0_ARUDO